MRKFLANTLESLATKEPFIFLTGDLGFEVFDNFKKNHPEKYLNLGIAESALITVASGLSSEGIYPIVYSIASFMTARPYEQIKLLVGYNEFPMLIVGAGGGVSYGMSGPTHHSCDDIALMSLVPGLNIAAPAGPLEMVSVVNECVDKKLPCYLRIGKFEDNDLPHKQILTGTNILIISTGLISHEAYQAKLKLESEGKDCDFIHFTYINHLNNNEVIEKIKEYKHVFVIEEHIPHGGLYSHISNLQSNFKSTVLVRIGLPSSFVHNFMSQDEIRKFYGIDRESIYNLVLEVAHT